MIKVMGTPQPIVEPVGYKGGHKFTRKEWERNHKPTCNQYPCRSWKEIHWHLDLTKHRNRPDEIKYSPLEQAWHNQ